MVRASVGCYSNVERQKIYLEVRDNLGSFLYMLAEEFKLWVQHDQHAPFTDDLTPQLPLLVRTRYVC
jgi:hypothetical protein